MPRGSPRTTTLRIQNVPARSSNVTDGAKLCPHRPCRLLCDFVQKNRNSPDPATFHSPGRDCLARL
jgi:hypothetical protein